jgi:hypothetical protein
MHAMLRQHVARRRTPEPDSTEMLSIRGPATYNNLLGSLLPLFGGDKHKDRCDTMYCPRRASAPIRRHQ